MVRDFFYERMRKKIPAKKAGIEIYCCFTKD